MDATASGPAAPPRPRHLLVVVVAAAWLALDQLTKSWALHALRGGEQIDVVWTLRFSLAYNTGAAFSVGGGKGVGPWIALLAVVVVGVLAWQGRSVRRPLGAVALGLVIGGALGNLVDRAFRTNGAGFLHGAVVDFIDLQWWPVFNVADIGVVVGAILLVFVGLTTDDDEDPVADDATSSEP